MENVKLHFEGPFSFLRRENSVFYCEIRDEPSIYFWTFKSKQTGKHLIHYIGQTNYLAKRQREHYRHILGLYYGVFDANAAQNGKMELLWKGLWRDKSKDAIKRTAELYLDMAEKTIEYIDKMEIFSAPVFVTPPKRRHIEGSIGKVIRSNPDFKAIYPDDNRVTARRKKMDLHVHITSSEEIFGLPEELNI